MTPTPFGKSAMQRAAPASTRRVVEALGSMLAIARTIKEEYRTPSEVKEIEKASLVYREALSQAPQEKP